MRWQTKSFALECIAELLFLVKTHNLPYEFDLFYAKILTTVKKRSKSKEKEDNVLGYSVIAGADKDERLACFLPLLHLSNNKKLWLEQYKHLDENSRKRRNRKITKPCTPSAR
jgi:chromatin segregation and condensation protein Rec8/ScpA/Scc1 (kleisin family)